MTYYDPKIYNFHNLHDDDKKYIVLSAFPYMNFDSVKDEFLPENENSTLEKIKYEIAEEVIDRIKEDVKNTLLELIVTYIDNYEEDIEPWCPSDVEDGSEIYFYGFDDYLNELSGMAYAEQN